jgi:hypothetical protein
MFAMIFLLELVEPALIAASMAVSRQGIYPPHLQGRSTAEDGERTGFLFPRGMRETQGKKLGPNRCGKGI